MFSYICGTHFYYYGNKKEKKAKSGENKKCWKHDRIRILEFYSQCSEAKE